MKQVYLEKYGVGGYKLYRVPSIVCTQKGTLIVCYECRYGGDWSAMDLVIRRSTDEGASWSERHLIVSGHEIDVIHNGILFADADKVHLVYHRNYREAWYVFSKDEGVNWSEPVNISQAYESLRSQYRWTVAAAGPGHGLVTSTGRMIVPVWLAANRANICDHHPSVVTTLYSDDHGKTWQCGDVIQARSDFVDPNESVIAELSDGSYMLNSRHETGGGLRKVGFSPDGIADWQGFFFDAQLPDPVCCAGMTQGDGKLWFVNCACDCSDSVHARDHLSLRRSDDDGKTWTKPFELDARGGYSDVFYSSEKKMLYVVAETGRAHEEDMWTFGLSVICVDPNELP